MSTNNIVLIGFMGSGKSSVGRVLAKKVDKYFLDTDAMIESSEGESIVDIFAQKGESYFRECERTTARWLAKNCDNAVISTGGGMLIYCEEVKEVGKVIYLRVPFEDIMKRMTDKELEKRPLFKDKDAALKLYNERDKIYQERSDMIVEVKGDIDDVVSSLLSLEL